MVLYIILCTQLFEVCYEKLGHVFSCLSQVLYTLLHVLRPLFIYLFTYYLLFPSTNMLEFFNSPLLLTASAPVFSACVTSWYTVAPYSKYCHLMTTAHFKRYVLVCPSSEAATQDEV